MRKWRIWMIFMAITMTESCFAYAAGRELIRTVCWKDLSMKWKISFCGSFALWGKPEHQTVHSFPCSMIWGTNCLIKPHSIRNISIVINSRRITSEPSSSTAKRRLKISKAFYWMLRLERSLRNWNTSFSLSGILLNWPKTVKPERIILFNSRILFTRKIEFELQLL